MIKKLVNFRGKIYWDKTKEDGMMRKLLDSSYLFKKVGNLRKICIKD